MKPNVTRYMAGAVKVAVAAFFCTGIFANCARVGSITGGPMDTLAPVVVRMIPEANTLNFTDKSVFIEFDEYVQIRNFQKEFFTSPHMKTTPTATIRGRGIRVEILDTLLPDRTYSLNFAGSIVDNNEGNPLNGFRYVFSTGDHIDSMVMSGYAVDAMEGDSVSKAFAFFFDAALDTIPQYDSVLLKNKPEAIGRAENNGIFIAYNLQPKPYRVYAVQDENGNGLYDAGIDMVGIADSTYNPASMPAFDAWYDTTRFYVVAQPQLYFRMFMDERTGRQNLQTPTRPNQHLAVLVFNSPQPEIESLTWENVDSTKVLTEYLLPTRDSVALWFDMPGEQLPDTIKGKITYMRPDSVGTILPYTQNLKLAWQKSESREEQRERERLEKEAGRAAEQGIEPPAELNPFKFTLTERIVTPGRGVAISFDYPLSAIDSAAIRLTRGDSTKVRPVSVAVHLVRDTIDMRTWHIEAEWVPDEVYDLVIPAGTLTDIAQQKNDSIGHRMESPSAQEVSTLKVDIAGSTPESLYIVELTDEGGTRVLDSRRYVQTGIVEFDYVAPGKVRLKITEDANGNGEWNTGNVVSRSQPERVEFFMNEPGEPVFEVRAGWIESKRIDMNQLFAPITMRGVIEKLEREEAVRLEKLIEALEKQREEQRRREEQGSGGNAMDMMRGSGLGLPGGF